MKILLEFFKKRIATNTCIDAYHYYKELIFVGCLGFLILILMVTSLYTEYRLNDLQNHIKLHDGLMIDIIEVHTKLLTSNNLNKYEKGIIEDLNKHIMETLHGENR